MNNVKKFVFFILLLMFFLPFIQKNTNLFHLKPLKGYFVLNDEPKLSNESWKTGAFQKNMNNFIEQNIGLRPLLIRINNQLAYNISRVALANGVIIGKKNFLFEESYINAYLGKNFIGKDKINNILSKALFLQNELKKKNIDLILVFAPGKASFFPEYIPDKYNPSYRTTTNYEYFVKHTKELGINHIDFNKYFMDLKNKSKYPLYPKCGIHWSTYGALIAADSIAKYIEKLRNINMPKINITSMEMSNKPRNVDNDIADGMNLLFEISHPDLAYPQWEFKSDSNSQKPSLMVVADSYFWQIYDLNIFGNVFKENSTFWYYNHDIIPAENPEKKYTSQVNKTEEIEKRDVIMILNAEPNLDNFSSSFIDQIYELYAVKNQKK